MNQIEKARQFHALHQAETPLILYNIWDVATAKVVEASGATAIATGSWSVAVAQGYEDGQNLPFYQLSHLARSLAAQTDLPVSIDFECGYSDTEADLEETFSTLLKTGIVGINFEDQDLGASGLIPVETQAKRIGILADVARCADIPAFINARTDMFLQEPDPTRHDSLIDHAIERAQAYAAAGASGFFIPGLSQKPLIAKLCQAVSLPVNVMAAGPETDLVGLAALGVKRISFGPAPFRALMAELEARAGLIYGKP